MVLRAFRFSQRPLPGEGEASGRGHVWRCVSSLRQRVVVLAHILCDSHHVRVQVRFGRQVWVDARRRTVAIKRVKMEHEDEGAGTLGCPVFNATGMGQNSTRGSCFHLLGFQFGEPVFDPHTLPFCVVMPTWERDHQKR